MPCRRRRRLVCVSRPIHHQSSKPDAASWSARACGSQRSRIASLLSIPCRRRWPGMQRRPRGCMKSQKSVCAAPWPWSGSLLLQQAVYVVVVVSVLHHSTLPALHGYNVRHWTQYPRQTLCPVQQLEATSSLPTSYYYHACSSLASHTVAAAGNRRRARTVRWISMPPARADESMHAPQQARRDADAAT